MALDSSIPLSIRPIELPDPLEAAGKLSRLQALRGQGQLQQLQLQEAQQASTDRSRLREIGVNATKTNPDGTKTLDQKQLINDAFSVDPVMAAKMQGDYAESERKSTKANAEAQKAQIEGVIGHLNAVAQIMGSVRDQASYDQALAQIRQLPGVDASHTPPAQYDPGFVAMTLRQGLGAKERLEQEYRNRSFEETSRHNRVTEGNQAQDSDLRRQQLESGKTPSGYRRTADGALEFIPGGPADPNNKGAGAASEDERKGAGWFNQADKAFKDMQAAIKLDGKSQSPGIIESIPGLPQAAKNVSRSDARQKYVQGASAFSEAVLRAATGAGVNRDEAIQKVTELTPQLGDGDDVIQQKTESMKNYLNSLQQRAGRALPKGTVNAGQAAAAIDDLVSKYAD